jgi:hypothetical protein
VPSHLLEIYIFGMVGKKMIRVLHGNSSKQGGKDKEHWPEFKKNSNRVVQMENHFLDFNRGGQNSNRVVN